MVLPVAALLAGLLMGRRGSWPAVIAAVASLAGGYAERALVVFAGNRSADEPALYFDLSRPGSTATTPFPTAVEAVTPTVNVR